MYRVRANGRCALAGHIDVTSIPGHVLTFTVHFALHTARLCNQQVLAGLLRTSLYYNNCVYLTNDSSVAKCQTLQHPKALVLLFLY
jgi:hypothetical protein